MAAGGSRNTLICEVGVGGRRDWSFYWFDYTHEYGLCTLSSSVKLWFNLNHGLWQVAAPSGIPAWSLPTKQRLDHWHLQNSSTPLPGGGERCDADPIVPFVCLTLPGYAWVSQVF